MQQLLLEGLMLSGIATVVGPGSRWCRAAFEERDAAEPEP